MTTTLTESDRKKLQVLRSKLDVLYKRIDKLVQEKIDCKEEILGIRYEMKEITKPLYELDKEREMELRIQNSANVMHHTGTGWKSKISRHLISVNDNSDDIP